MPRKKYKPNDVYRKRLEAGVFPTVQGEPIEFIPGLDTDNLISNEDYVTAFNHYYYEGFGFQEVENSGKIIDYSASDAVKGVKNVLKHLNPTALQGTEEEFEEVSMEDIDGPEPLKFKNKPLLNIIQVGYEYLKYSKLILERMYGSGLAQADYAFLDHEKLMKEGVYAPDNEKIQAIQSELTFDKMIDIYASQVKQEDLLKEADNIKAKAPRLNKKGYMINPMKADDNNLEEALDAYNNVACLRKKRGIIWKILNPIKNYREGKAFESIENSLKNYGVSKDTLKLARNSNIVDLTEAKQIARDESTELYNESNRFNNYVLDGTNKENYREQTINSDLRINEQKQALLQDQMEIDNIFQSMRMTGNKETRNQEIQDITAKLNRVIEIYNKYQEVNKERQQGTYKGLPGLSAIEISIMCTTIEDKLYGKETGGLFTMANIDSLIDGKKIDVDKVVKNKFEKIDERIRNENNRIDLSEDVESLDESELDIVH